MTLNKFAIAEYRFAYHSAKLKTIQHIQKPGHYSRLYLVNTIAFGNNFSDIRCPIICGSFERAAECVENNEGDIWEFSYNLVVIEAVLPDRLYGNAELDEQYWYMYNHAQNKYLAIERPENLKGQYGFLVG